MLVISWSVSPTSVDAGTVGQIREMWVILAVARRPGHVLVQRHVRRTVGTERGGLVVDAQVLLQLPTASLALTLGLADGLGQHEGAHDAQELNKGDCDGTRGDEHRTLGDHEAHALEAAGLEDHGAVTGSGAAVGNGDLTACSNTLVRPVLPSVDSAALQLGVN